MKRICLIIILIGTIHFGHALEVQLSDGPQVDFNETFHDFGDLIQGDKASHTFEFTNTGKQPLVISNVLTTCGCTATKWPKKPIQPGKTGQIKITFDSTGKMGKQNKIITVLTNADPQHTRLSISASVLPRKGSY
jgi:hypothetical protein